MRGEDVLKLQLRLQELNYGAVGQPDGLFGHQTDLAVHALQQSQDLSVDGIVGPLTWTALFEGAQFNTPTEKMDPVWRGLRDSRHAFPGGAKWRLSSEGILVADSTQPEISGGPPKTVRRVWTRFGASIETWAAQFGIPVELIIATICTETSGDPLAVWKEPKYESDAETPDQISPGLMQTLISTARQALGDDTIDREWLLTPDNSIRAGSAYIAQQWRRTHFDPPKVACAYNAGGVYRNDGEENRWKMKQYPLDTGKHADRFVEWFNDCFLLFKDEKPPALSFYKKLESEKDANSSSG